MKNKLLDGDIFEEIKKMRQSKPVIATSMDGENENIPEHYKNVQLLQKDQNDIVTYPVDYINH